MSYDPNERIAHFEQTGTEPSAADFYRMMQYHQAIRDKKQRDRRELSRQIEDEELSQSQKRRQKADLMATSNFNVASIMPQVKSLVADKQFLDSGNASQSNIGGVKFSAKGGRRTRHKRSGHKRSGHKNRSGKRSKSNKKRMSRRR
jgi:hypothetical protein